MISKELLSEVLRIYPIHIEDEPIIEKEYIVFKKTLNSAIAHSRINIYELAYKCKEWVSKQKYHIQINLYLDGLYRVTIIYKSKYDKTQFDADTEPEAIFKACEWVNEQHDN